MSDTGEPLDVSLIASLPKAVKTRILSLLPEGTACCSNAQHSTSNAGAGILCACLFVHGQNSVCDPHPSPLCACWAMVMDRKDTESSAATLVKLVAGRRLPSIAEELRRRQGISIKDGFLPDSGACKVRGHTYYLHKQGPTLHAQHR